MVRVQVVKAALTLCLSADVLYGAAASYLPRNENSPAPTITPAPTIVQRATESFTAVTGCHAHGDDVYCQVGTDEYQIIVPATATGDIAPEYTGCHSHGSETFCLGDGDIEVEVLVDAEEASHDSGEAEADSGGENCHFHAGVEHCPGDSSEVQCSRRDRDYNIPLRIGLVFAMLVTSFIGKSRFTYLPQADFTGRFPDYFHGVEAIRYGCLMFNNECLGELEYEAVTAAIVMAGLFIAFLVENISHRIARRYWDKTPDANDVVSVTVLEAGIIFHSLLVGLTLVVAGDSVFITLFVIIVFHQAFEGIALGSRIATAGRLVKHTEDGSSAGSPVDNKTVPAASGTASNSASLNEGGTWKPLSMLQKLAMATAFAVVTPIGMAIGIGVLHQFNGNDPSTVIAIGTLDALSAGILLWVGVVEMWATDWLFGGELENAKLRRQRLEGSVWWLEKRSRSLLANLPARL
ncbi:hypothetical protein EKO27_g7964 [Xylaria grammica]|uniref:Uncharacterized protein n=1 Tax=Xylaria grammica TaxID=363999 RepID=A0A439CYD7_9PEZI|nr:hypothetical protein EKO27_g7964 [Xylaria grammica]